MNKFVHRKPAGKSLLGNDLGIPENNRLAMK